MQHRADGPPSPHYWRPKDGKGAGGGAEDSDLGELGAEELHKSSLHIKYQTDNKTRAQGRAQPSFKNRHGSVIPTGGFFQLKSPSEEHTFGNKQSQHIL
jgi:hypothetical protein